MMARIANVLLPGSLFGRMALLLLLGLILAQFLTASILLRDRGQVLYDSIQEGMITRTVDIVRLLDSLTVAEREKLLPVLSGPDLKLFLADQPVSAPEPDNESALAAEVIQAQLLKRLPRGTRVQVGMEGFLMEPRSPAQHRRHMMEGGPMSGPWAYMHGIHAMAQSFLIQVQLQDRSWVIFERGFDARLFDWPTRLLIALGVLLVSVVLLSLIGVRYLVRPLQKMKLAAEGLGKDIHQPPLQEAGPAEVRDTAKAFNTMQSRLKNYIEDRSEILAAVSHDLKTPLTRLRLRAGLMQNEELREKTEKDLDDMESMVSATLDFMRGTETGEPNQALDLMALLESVQEDAWDAGENVELEGQVFEPYYGKPLALKRCLINLIGNAIRYGEEARISIRDEGNSVTINICDSGPGIPKEALKRVFDPFYRLENSRAQHTGGTGLGLGIARNIARAHGGELVLQNQAGGGLCARLVLPR